MIRLTQGYDGGVLWVRADAVEFVRVYAEGSEVGVAGGSVFYVKERPDVIVDMIRQAIAP